MLHNILEPLISPQRHFIEIEMEEPDEMEEKHVTRNSIQDHLTIRFIRHLDERIRELEQTQQIIHKGKYKAMLARRGIYSVMFLAMATSATHLIYSSTSFYGTINNYNHKQLDHVAEGKTCGEEHPLKFTGKGNGLYKDPDFFSNFLDYSTCMQAINAIAAWHEHPECFKVIKDLCDGDDMWGGYLFCIFALGMFIPFFSTIFFCAYDHLQSIHSKSDGLLIKNTYKKYHRIFPDESYDDIKSMLNNKRIEITDYFNSLTSQELDILYNHEKQFGLTVVDTISPTNELKRIIELAKSAQDLRHEVLNELDKIDAAFSKTHGLSHICLSYLEEASVDAEYRLPVRRAFLSASLPSAIKRHPDIGIYSFFKETSDNKEQVEKSQEKTIQKIFEFANIQQLPPEFKGS